MVYRVRSSARAKRDLDAILTWLQAHEAGDAGLEWFEGLVRALKSLHSMPQRCGVAPENGRSSPEVRQLLYGNKPHVYRVLFTIEGETVTVLHIRHGRRQPSRRN